MSLEIEIKESLAEIVGEQKSTATAVEQLKGSLKEVQDGLTSATDTLTVMQQKGFGGGLLKPEGRKSLGRQIIESDAFKSVATRSVARAGVEFKNTILGEGGSPQNPVDTIAAYGRHGALEGGAFRRLRLLDVIPRGMTNSNSVHITKEASWSNGAAETAEGAQKPEATLTFTDLDSPVRTVAHFLKVSRQVMDDAPALESYIESRLRHGVEQRLEAQIVAGNGTSPNLSGMTTTGNHTDLTLVTADNDFDAMNRAKVQVLASDYQPDMFILNPSDWGRLERTKTGISGDDSYLAGGDNAIRYLANGMQPMVWGLPVIVSNSMTAGQFLCLSRDAVMLFDRQRTVVEIFDQNEDDVEKNLLTIRAEGRWAFAVFRPAAVIHGALPDA